MKHLKYLLLICLAAAAACSKDKTEDPTLKAQRTALQETQAVGIYRSGEALWKTGKRHSPSFGADSWPRS